MPSAPLNALHAFLAVARAGSFSAAARDLGLSASALSQAVKRLEEQLDVVLLHRTSRSMSLTDVGQRLLDQAGPALDGALEALELATATPGELSGTVRLSVPHIATGLVLRHVLPRFAQRHPRVEVDVRVDNAFVDIVEQGLDAGMRLVEAIDRDMVQVRLHGPLRLVVAGAPSYLARKGVPASPRDLVHHDCIGMRFSPNGPAYVWELGEGEHATRIPVTGPVVTNDSHLMRLLACEGMGLICGMETSIATELARGELVLVLEDHALHLPGLFLYFPSRAQVSPALRAFIDVAREVCAAEGLS